jgi:hypothetical protein
MTPPARDVFDDVIAERDALRQQVAMLTEELERLKAYEHLAIKYHDQNATLTEALEKLRVRTAAHERQEARTSSRT